MRAPEFWYAESGIAARLLTPASWFYDAGGILRRALVRPRTTGAPVICIGNLVAGGAGKTPVALAIASLLRDRKPAFLTRGYGGRLSGPVRVDPAAHTVSDVGDEALLLAAVAPTWLAHDRVAGARAAVAEGAGVVVMDDGFQNPGLAKDLSLVVIDGETGFGNGRVLPAGPLREVPVYALKRAHGVVIIGTDKNRLAGRLPVTLPVFSARLVPTPDAQTLTERRIVAFAGIGRPQKFFDSLIDLGCQIVSQRPFADHHPYEDQEIEDLIEEATTHDAIAVTTAKDAARLSPEQRKRIRVVDVVLEWESESSIRRFLKSLRSA